MHIAIVSHIFYPDKGDPFNGSELAMRMVERGHKVSVITWNMNKRIPEESISKDLTIFRLCGYNFGFFGVEEYPFLPSLPSLIKKLRPDIIHAQSHTFLTTIQSLMAGAKYGIPSVLTVHG